MVKWHWQLPKLLPTAKPRSHGAAADISIEIPKKDPREGTKPLGCYHLRGYNLKKKKDTHWS